MVEEGAVVGHEALEGRVRPVGAPDDAVLVGLDQRPREGRHVVVGRAGQGGDPVGAGELRPALAVAQEGEERLEARMVEAAIGAHVAEMAEGDVDGHGVHGCAQVVEVVDVDEHFEMPAKRREALGEGLHRAHARKGIAALVREVDAHAARAALMQRLEFPVRHVRLDGDDRAIGIADVVEHVHHAGIVGAVDARLREDGPLDAAERVMQRPVVVEGGRRRRVATLRRERIALDGPEDVGVAIDRPARQGEGRRHGRGIGTLAGRVGIGGHERRSLLAMERWWSRMRAGAARSTARNPTSGCRSSITFRRRRGRRA